VDIVKVMNVDIVKVMNVDIVKVTLANDYQSQSWTL